jgi:hypothetical protein
LSQREETKKKVLQRNKKTGLQQNKEASKILGFGRRRKKYSFSIFYSEEGDGDF